MASSITIPSLQTIGLLGETAAEALIALATQAQADGNALIPADPVALTDAGSTSVARVGKVTWVSLPAATLSANRSYALPALAGCSPGDRVLVTRLDIGAFTAAFTDSGSGTATLFTMPVSKVNSAEFILNVAGTHWLLLRCGVQ